MSNIKKLDKQNIEDILALTPVQEGMLFHYLSNPESGLYFEQMSFGILGDMDRDVFKTAWDFVIETNEMLRTVYRWEGIEKPVQVVLKKHGLLLREYDISNTCEAKKQEVLDEIRMNDRKERIDISSEPFRITLCKVDKNLYEMIVSSYHIIYDGWSNGILLKEFLKAYNEFHHGLEPQKSVKTKYREYIKWCHNQDKEKRGRYWEEYVKGFQSKTILPVDRKKQDKAAKTQTYTTFVEGTLSNEIKSFAKRQDVTLASLLYSAWGILLEKYNDSYDVVFGTTVSGRTPEVKGVEDVVGLFINTPPMRIQSSSDDVISNLISKVDTMLRDRDEFECTPLTEIKPFLEIDSKEELFDSIVVIENYPLDSSYNENDSKIKIRLNSIFEMTNYDLTFVISTFDHIGIRMIYDAKIFDHETMERLSDQYIQILKEMMAKPQKSLSAIDILTEADKRALLFDFNNTEEFYIIDRTIHELFEEQVINSPDSIAVVFEDQSLTYRELNEKSNQLARLLQKKGVKNETVVGIMVEPSLDMIISILAVLKAGGAYLPIDLHVPADRITYMLEDSGAKVLITTSHSVHNVPYTSLQNFQSNDGCRILVTNPRGHIQEFDTLPVPDRSLIDLGKYKGKIGMASINNCISLQTTRGCPYKCLYCHKVWSKNHVRRSVENIYGEIEYYYRNGVRNFAVIDDCFNLDMKNSVELFKLIIKNNLKIQIFFPNGLRGDILTPEYIDLMVEAGTRGINLSLETASPRLQSMLMKNLDLEKFKNVVDYIATKHSEIILEMATMHGFPTETEEEAMMTLNFIKDIKWLHFPYIHILKIFPNTEMEAFALEHGVLKADILKSKDRAFHELPETLPFPKSFTRRYQASFMNEYFLSKERLKHVLPVQMRILDEGALAQKYNAYLPVEINSVADLIRFAELDDFILPENSRQKIEIPYSIYDKPEEEREEIPGAKKIMFLDLSQHFSSHNMLYKVAEQPIGQIYLLTYLKKVFGEKIDGRIYKSGNDFDSFEELKELVDEFKPDMIGIRTLTYFKEFFHEIVSLLRQWGITVPIITGGPYASSDYDTILKDRNVNLVVFGEGEYTLAELVGKMLENSFELPESKVLRNIDGIAFIDESQQFVDKSCQVFMMDRIKDVLAQEDKKNLYCDVSPKNLAYVMYTSGSTGKPKGVMVEHRQVNNCIFWMQNEFRLKSSDVIVQRTNLTFDPSVWEIFWPLYKGASVKLITSEQGRDAEFLLSLMSGDNGLTMMYCPASLVTGMLYLLNTRTDSSRLKMPWLIIGAEPISMDTVKGFYAFYDGKIVNTYGPTECTINNTCYSIEKDDKRSIVPIGKPVANNRIYILSKDKQLMPVNALGEMYIAGDNVARGYIHNPEKTAENFIENPFGKGRLYKTGDIGKWLCDGSIEIQGRVDEQVKVRGYRIELGEIESAILRHKTVKECVVVVKGSKKAQTEIKECKSCGITSKYPGIKINEEGLCDICQDFNIYKGYMDKYFKSLDDLDLLLKEKSRSKKGKYDCLLLYSGGRGSAYALYRLVEMGYQVLALTYDNGYFTKSDLENITMITNKLEVDHVVVTHKNTDKIMKESCKAAHTVCRGCFHISSSLAGEYAYDNNIPVVIGATLSRGQIIENKLLMFYKQGISDVSEIEKELLNIQKSARQMDKTIFDHMDIENISNGAVYDHVRFVDFYRYCDITNQEMISFLNYKDEYWNGRKKYAVYSTNCPIKQIGDYCHLREKEFHYYGSAISWEKRLDHITLENVKEDLTCYPTEKAFENFSRRIGYESVKQGEKIDTKYICAYYVPETELSGSEIREFLSDKLPGYMIPTYFIKLDQIPVTSNNKIDKKALPEPEENKNVSVEYVAPENETEEILAEIWQKVLAVDRVGVNDNFFDLGGNSILLIQIHSQVDRKFPGKTMMMDLFAYPTLSKLAAFIDSKKEKMYQPISVKSVELPMSYFSGGEKDLQAAAYSFTMNKQMLEKVKRMSGIENITPDDVWVAVYTYLFAQITGKQEITVQSITGDINRVIPISNDFNTMKDFIELFKSVNQQRRNEKQDGVYEIQEIESAVVNKGNTSVIPLIYKRGLADIKRNLLDLYDISLEYDESEGEMKFQLEYNGKMLKSEKMKELVNGYFKLTKMLIDQYEPKGVVL